MSHAGDTAAGARPLPPHVPAKLVEITPATHGVRLDVRYATPDNITGRPLYAAPRVFLRPEAATRLKVAADLARAAGLELVIFDGYRPVEAQMRLWRVCPDENYVYPPWKGSTHTRGIAVDLTLAAADGGPLLDMGTEFDDMTERSHPASPLPGPVVLRNRMLLAGIMTTAGFAPIATEWWHFQLPGDDWPLIATASLPVPLLAKGIDLPAR